MKAKKPIAIAIASLGLCLITLGGIASCKQGEGERCELTSDCEGDLECNVAQHICRVPGTGGDLDAQPPADAAPDTM